MHALLARKFLYVIAAIILLILALGISWAVFQDRFIRWTFVPSADFAGNEAGPAPDYAKVTAWVARPDLSLDPSRYTPPGFTAAAYPRAAIFYIPPTTYLSKARWNGPVTDPEAKARTILFAKSQASAFNGIGPVWAPYYRQATLGAFLVAGDPRAAKAMDLAYADVARAFDVFVAAQPLDRPIILAGHSQGSLHLLRLLREKVRGTELRSRVVAAYAIGWPISSTADLPALSLPACKTPDSHTCLVSWQSFAEPTEPRLIAAYFDATTGYAGLPRKGTTMLCSNPLTGIPGGSAPASANRGALVPNADYSTADLKKGLVGAACTPEGILSIGAPPEGFGGYVLPGNNYHVFDYALFWANLRADAERRTATMPVP
ncbi:DUF3089 domain-containing protein [Sphingomonas sp.]|uniref:DUF3089 domain-containing protein n=1 Tax=Sphingomonas sp. TaxID=28214 RepID=UPI0025F473BE|nr:DUF3089 domain-containing protein [Sphingomonas sp.]